MTSTSWQKFLSSLESGINELARTIENPMFILGEATSCQVQSRFV
jgi:hypothetical protein